MWTPVRSRRASRPVPKRHRRRCQRMAVAAATTMCLLVLVLVPATVAAQQPCWQPPVDAPVRDPFRPPRCRWCAGNRGIEYATRPGTSVRSVAAGTVSYSGTVAGTRYVVVEHANGWRTTYGDLARTGLQTGDVVVAGSVVGVARSRMHFGLRTGTRYVDPAPYLGEPTYPTRLIPLDGSRAAPAGRPRLTCGR